MRNDGLLLVLGLLGLIDEVVEEGFLGLDFADLFDLVFDLGLGYFQGILWKGVHGNKSILFE
jgi:hypothetical protein